MPRASGRDPVRDRCAVAIADCCSDRGRGRSGIALAGRAGRTPDQKSAGRIECPSNSRAAQPAAGAGAGGRWCRCWRCAGAGSAMLDRPLDYFALPSSQRRLEEQRGRVRDRRSIIAASRSSTARASGSSDSRMWICSRAGDDAAMWLVSDFARDKTPAQSSATHSRPAPPLRGYSVAGCRRYITPPRSAACV